jgi:hypothetical protein
MSRSSSRASTSSNTETITKTTTPQLSDSDNADIFAGVENSTIQMLDNGAIEGAFEVVHEATGQVVDSVTQQQEYNLMFAGQAITANLESANSVMDGVGKFASEAIDSVIEANDDAHEKAYAFSAGAVNTAFAQVEKARVDGYTYAGQAQTTIMGYSNQQMDRITQAVTESNLLVQETSKQAANNMLSNSRYAMDQVQGANKSESKDIAEKLIMGAVAVVALKVLA